ncbi:MAG: hypothetical protein WBD27_09525 [Pyrinomonadaceae bacterium]
MKILWLSSFFVLILLQGNFVNAQSETCKVRTYFLELESKSSSSWFLVGEFPLELEDDAITKSFRHQESGVDVSVGVEQVKSIFKNESKSLRIALSFAGKPENVFDALDRAEAETLYDKNWKLISVTKNIQIANRIYTFTFGCARMKNRQR